MASPTVAQTRGPNQHALVSTARGGARVDGKRVLLAAREALRTEAEAVSALIERVDERFVEAVTLMLNCRGRVVVTGVGKSAHIGRKIAATLASTGTPAFFMHASEASHGDLGMVTVDDVLFALSNSGESEELLAIVPSVKRQGTSMIALTGNGASSLARLAEVHLDAHVEREACPHDLAPTASTTAALALGDALAVVLLELRGFSRDDYARTHPGGALGRRLLTRVADVMRSGERVPIVRVDTPFATALLEMTRKGMAMTAVIEADDALAGIFTDGDLRRLLERGESFQARSIGELMHRNPRVIESGRLAVEAAQMMEEHRINQLLVVDETGALVGALHIHDLTNAKVI
jgi:arabinose-5-phosphate isomerase